MSSVPPESFLRGAVDLSALVQRASAPARPAGSGEPDGQAGGNPSLIVSATDANFQRVLELSSTVPVVVEFVAPALEPALGAIVESYGGRLVLAVVDAQSNPQLAQAFQVREVPAVAAVVGGRPVNLFLGIPSDAEVRQVLDELLQLAAQNGVTGTVPVGADGDDAGAAPEPVEEPLPPRHQAAYDAIARGDFLAAMEEYRQAIAESPRDAQAVAGLAQAALLHRLQGVEASAIRTAAAERPGDVEAQLAVADLDVSGGHLGDAFDRLLELFPSLDGDGRTAVRTRLLDYFEIAGPEDERVIAARRRLTNLLY